MSSGILWPTMNTYSDNNLWDRPARISVSPSSSRRRSSGITCPQCMVNRTTDRHIRTTSYPSDGPGAFWPFDWNTCIFVYCPHHSYFMSSCRYPARQHKSIIACLSTYTHLAIYLYLGRHYFLELRGIRFRIHIGMLGMTNSGGSFHVSVYV